MTAINKNNYEVFFLDYIEERLDAEQIAALMLFIDANPELKEELEGLELVKLEPQDDFRYPGKEKLKKPLLVPVGYINEQNYESYFIAAAEGDLQESEYVELDKFLFRNPALGKEYKLIQQCRLKPDANVVFSNKSILKRNIIASMLPRFYYYSAAIAASLALMIGLKLIFKSDVAKQEKIAGFDYAIHDTKGSGEHDSGIVNADLKPEEKASEKVDGLKTSFAAKISDNKHTIGVTPAQSLNEEIRNTIVINQLASILEPAQINGSPFPRISTDARLYFSNYFPDIAIAQQIRYAEIHSETAYTSKLLARGSAIVKEIFRPGDEEIRLLPKQINLWEIADASINGFALITNSDMEFRKENDNEGKVTAFAFESQSMQISRNIRRDK